VETSAKVKLNTMWHVSTSGLWSEPPRTVNHIYS